MDFYVVLARAGKRVARRRARASTLGNFQMITKEEAKQWFTEKLGGTVL
jgi:large subunit ribosomal protein L11e